MDLKIPIVIIGILLNISDRFFSCKWQRLTLLIHGTLLLTKKAAWNIWHCWNLTSVSLVISKCTYSSKWPTNIFFVSLENALAQRTSLPHMTPIRSKKAIFRLFVSETQVRDLQHFPHAIMLPSHLMVPCAYYSWDFSSWDPWSLEELPLEQA